MCYCKNCVLHLLIHQAPMSAGSRPKAKSKVLSKGQTSRSRQGQRPSIEKDTEMD